MKKVMVCLVASLFLVSCSAGNHSMVRTGNEAPALGITVPVHEFHDVDEEEYSGGFEDTEVMDFVFLGMLGNGFF